MLWPGLGQSGEGEGDAKARLRASAASLRISTAAGGNVSAVLAMDRRLDDGTGLGLVRRIAVTIHGAKDRARYAMNNALIAIGGSGEGRRRAAL